MSINVKETSDIELYLIDILDGHRLMRLEIPFDDTKKEFAFGLYKGEQIIGGLMAKEALGEFYIHLLAIISDYRGLSFGKLLVEKTEEKARKRGCHHMLLTTYSYQAARFYPKIGFS